MDDIGDIVWDITSTFRTYARALSIRQVSPDRAGVDLICGWPIIKWITKTCLHDKVLGNNPSNDHQ